MAQRLILQHVSDIVDTIAGSSSEEPGSLCRQIVSICLHFCPPLHLCPVLGGI